MTDEELAFKINNILDSRVKLCDSLVAPARAAVNQMKDAGMKAGSEKLNEILFQIDALEEEMQVLVDNNLHEVIRIFLSS